MKRPKRRRDFISPRCKLHLQFVLWTRQSDRVGTSKQTRDDTADHTRSHSIIVISQSFDVMSNVCADIARSPWKDSSPSKNKPPLLFTPSICFVGSNSSVDDNLIASSSLSSLMGCQVASLHTFIASLCKSHIDNNRRCVCVCDGGKEQIEGRVSPYRLKQMSEHQLQQPTGAHAWVKASDSPDLWALTSSQGDNGQNFGSHFLSDFFMSQRGNVVWSKHLWVHYMWNYVRGDHI